MFPGSFSFDDFKLVLRQIGSFEKVFQLVQDFLKHHQEDYENSESHYEEEKEEASAGGSKDTSA